MLELETIFVRSDNCQPDNKAGGRGTIKADIAIQNILQFGTIQGKANISEIMTLSRGHLGVVIMERAN